MMKRSFQTAHENTTQDGTNSVNGIGPTTAQAQRVPIQAEQAQNQTAFSGIRHNVTHAINSVLNWFSPTLPPQPALQLPNQANEGPVSRTVDNAFKHFINLFKPNPYQNLSLAEKNKKLKIAVRTGDVVAVQTLIDAGADINKKYRGGMTPLQIAAANGQTEVVSILIDEGAALNEQNSGGNTAMHWAIGRGHTNIVRMLVKAGAAINLYDNSDQTPLAYASVNGQIDIAQILLDAGAAVNQQSRFSNSTALFGAAARGNNNMVQFLLKNGAAINHRDRYDNIPLHNAAESGNVDTVRILVDTGTMVRHQNNEGTSPLHNAALVGRSNIVKFLLDNGAAINQLDYQDNTALHLASRSLYGVSKKSNIDTIQTLLQAGANTVINHRNKDGKTPLHQAVCNPYADILQILLKVPGANTVINQPDKYGMTPLHWAACVGYIGTTRALLNVTGIIINALDNNLNTPLHETAIFRSHQDIVEALITAGIDIQAVNRDGKTAIEIACEHGNFEIVQLLLRNNATLPERFREIYEQYQYNSQRLNCRQSTHTVSVHVSVSKSAKRLLQYYNNPQQVATARQALLDWGKSLSDNSLQASSAKKALDYLAGSDFNDIRSGVTLQELLGLTWLGIHDESQINYTLPDAKQTRLQRLIEHLYQIQRGDNLDDNDVDDGQPIDKIICIPGAFNKLVEALNTVHNQVEILFVTPRIMEIKKQALIETAFNNLPTELKNHYGTLWCQVGTMPEEFAERIKDQLSQDLHQAFDEFREEVPNYETIIPGLIATLGYIQAKDTQAVLAWQATITLSSNSPTFTPAADHSMITAANEVPHSDIRQGTHLSRSPK